MSSQIEYIHPKTWVLHKWTKKGREYKSNCGVTCKLRGYCAVVVPKEKCRKCYV